MDMWHVTLTEQKVKGSIKAFETHCYQKSKIVSYPEYITNEKMLNINVSFSAYCTSSFTQLSNLSSF